VKEQSRVASCVEDAGVSTGKSRDTRNKKTKIKKRIRKRSTKTKKAVLEQRKRRVGAKSQEGRWWDMMSKKEKKGRREDSSV